MSEYNIQMNKYNTLSDDYDQLYPKPMKHASTHAKDSSDPILPSSIGAYSKSEVDTLLENKADAGYGFNGDLRQIIYWDDTDGTKFESDVDEILLGMGDGISKRFKVVDYPACVVSGNGGYADIYSVDAKGINNSCTIVYYAFWGDGKVSMAFKEKQGGVWYPWEYVNPPMLIGKEYRTTERYQGQPVYAKAIHIGNLPNASTKTISNYAENVKYVVNFDGYSYYFGQSLRNSDFAMMYVLNTYIKVQTFTNLSAGDAAVWVKYTKTTD